MRNMSFVYGLLALAAAFEPSANASAQTLEGVSVVTGASAEGVAFDKDGNVFTTGIFVGRVDFDPGPNVHELFSPRRRTGNSGAAYVLKQSGTGQFQWVRKIDIPGFEQPTGIVVDKDGNALVTGYHEWTGSTGRFYLKKYNPNGTVLWSIEIGNSTGENVAVDGAGNVYATGHFLGAADFDPGPGTTNLTGENFILKLDGEGRLIWAKGFGAKPQATGFVDNPRIAVDAGQNVVLTGRFWGEVDFDPGSNSHVLSSTLEYPLRPSYDVFVLKLDSSGDFTWVKQIGGFSFEEGTGAAIDSKDNIVIAGDYVTRVDFDPGPGEAILEGAGHGDMFVLKLDGDGRFTWVRRLGTPRGDEARGLALDAGDNIYVGGFFSDTPLHGQAGDIVISKWTAAGTPVWTARARGSGFGTGNAVAATDNGSVVAAGYFRGLLDFDPSNSVLEVLSKAYAGFVWKLR